MDNFIVSARKYRPATFDTVVGQSSITTTLKNAIKNNHLAQAFLFCGPRGVGKTTCARILAKTINCQNIKPNTEACDECDSCLSFNNNQSLNIYELDAASNNSVDDIRSLTEQVRFAPQLGKYKIYIIDEVHMLSTNAFNAFLKTLEEPPAYAKFILATTEKHKILPTILSRCQIFEFNRIQIEDIANHLAQIAVKESITADSDGLHIIAQKADGALRDSLSMFDQIVSYAGNHITYQAVIENLNILDYDYYFKLTDFLLQGNISSALLMYNDILNNGFDGHHFIGGLASHFRDLLMCKDEVTLKLLEVSPGIKEKYRIQSQQCSPAFLLHSLDIASKCEAGYKSAKNYRLHVELALMKMCVIGNSGTALDADEAVKKKLNSLTEARELPSTQVQEQPNQIPVGQLLAQKAAPAIPPTVVTQSIASTISGSVSISASLQGIKTPASPVSDETQRPATVVVEPVHEAKPFTQAELEKQWKIYADQVVAQGKKNLYSTLTKHTPILNPSDFSISLLFDNSVQESDMMIERQELLNFLRTQLSNRQIALELVKNEQLEQSKQLYTDADKFQYMAEKNPLLLDLKQALGLTM